MRLFIALPLPPEAVRAAENAQNALRRGGTRGRFAPPENLHVTLAFLGSVQDPQPAIEAMRRVPLPRATLRFEKLTLFGDVLVALLQTNAALEKYVRALRSALDDAGVRYNRESFAAHVTLARKTGLPDGAALRYADRAMRSFRLPVTEARLVQSDLSGPVPRYRTVSAVKRGGIGDQ
jgi:2'-5' RNA ligase